MQFSNVGRLGRMYTFGSWITQVFSSRLLAATTSKATRSTPLLSLLLTVVRESFSIKALGQKVLVLPESSRAYVQ